MKSPTFIETIMLLGVTALLAVSLLGCAPLEHKQILIKSTTFGLQIGSSPGNAGIPQIQLGLIRNSYISNPTSTNEIYSAPLTTHSDADIGLTRQHAKEDISTQ